jgi:hypothetical protein
MQEYIAKNLIGGCLMFLLSLNKWSFDADLQIIHADVKLNIHGDVLIDEPLCIDVGLPALLLSASERTEPNRWASHEEWPLMPFFVCGCGDAECRAFSFVVEHIDETWLQISEVDERQNDHYRVAGEYKVLIEEYSQQVEAIGRDYLEFVRDLDYRPYLSNTVEVVERLLKQLTDRRR